jgi:isoleucyl-tRNA synthetase
VDYPTKWFVPRSRRRFCKSQHDSDKNEAYATLYHVLVKLSRLLAPFTPFITETMYQNLVVGMRENALESIHHTRWPKVDAAVIDQALLDNMALARNVASLGLAARSGSNLKVRQPLARAMAHVADGNRTLSVEMVDVIMDELNVKTFEFVDDAGKLVNYRIQPDNKLLGPRFGAQFPRVRAALLALDPAKVAASVEAGQPIYLNLDGQVVELAPSEVIVQTSPVEGLAVAVDKGIMVAIDAVLTPELKAEGLAREIVRRIQEMRKKAGFNIDDRIITTYQASSSDSKLALVLEGWIDYIRAETLTLQLEKGPTPPGAYSESHVIEGETITLAVKRAA